MKHALIITPLFATLVLGTPAIAAEGDPEPRMNKKEMAEKLARKAEMSPQDEPETPPDVKSGEDGEEAGLLLPAVQKVRSAADKPQKDSAPEEPRKEEALHHLRKAYD